MVVDNDNVRFLSTLTRLVDKAIFKIFEFVFGAKLFVRSNKGPSHGFFRHAQDLGNIAGLGTS